ncbi:hypothetical protein FACS1894162_0890 [Bacteroidia bacterium]|nr:hypothetical protein FACS1894162_0890 [Bacteroidia bacterium]
MKVSIITVNLNNAAGLEKTIQSVVSQEFTDYEYIVIDGNSTDRSVEIIKKYSDHIHYWVSEPDLGIYNAMNKGIAQASGEYVIFINSGDCFFAPDTLSKVFTKEHTTDFIVGNAQTPYNGVTLHIKPPTKLTFYQFFIDTLNHQATFTKRNLFDELGLYDEQLKIASDWKFALLAIVKYDKTVEIVGEYIAATERVGTSDVGDALTIIKKEKEDTFRTYFPYIYDDYLELHRWRRFTFARWIRFIRWTLLRHLPFKH